jgi:hypothetical protein
MGTAIPRLADAEQAYAMLLHMLQHFLRSGFGLKLLCDWTVFWNHDHGEAEKARYLRLIRESGVKGFSDMVTAVCVYRLGLRREQVSFLFADAGEALPGQQDAESFLREILDSGEFGKSEKDRMVVLRGTGPLALAREFHHQMQLNFPKGGRIFVCWPGLWLVTLLRFMRNNRTIRHVSARELVKKARQRSRLTRKMRLFEV